MKGDSKGIRKYNEIEEVRKNGRGVPLMIR
jgi:hypothetical protein